MDLAPGLSETSKISAAKGIQRARSHLFGGGRLAAPCSHTIPTKALRTNPVTLRYAACSKPPFLQDPRSSRP